MGSSNFGTTMQSVVWTSMLSRTQTRTFWSQEHVATAIPFPATDSDVMRFSWPARQPVMRTSHCIVGVFTD